MSLSKECQEYHLTPRGWIEGNFDGDVVGGKKKTPIPPDRVLTIGCYDELASAFSETHFYDEVLWSAEDKKSIHRLKKKYGDRPDWFGYKHMRRA